MSFDFAAFKEHPARLADADARFVVGDRWDSQETPGCFACPVGVPLDLPLLQTLKPKRLWRYSGKVTRADGSTTPKKNADSWSSQSQTFGLYKRNPGKSREQGVSSMHFQNRVLHDYLMDLGVVFAERFKTNFPEAYAEHMQAISSAPGEGFGLTWTSGIYNLDSRLPYHKDGNNVAGSYSCMLTLKQDCVGGELVFPRIRRALDLPDRSLFFFRGSVEPHGVAPFDVKPGGHRITIVWFYPGGFV